MVIVACNDHLVYTVAMMPARLQRLLRRLPLAGHPAVETLLERSASREAYRAGRFLVRVLHHLAPRVDPNQMVQSFADGVTDGRPAARNEGRVYRFPGS